MQEANAAPVTRVPPVALDLLDQMVDQGGMESMVPEAGMEGALVKTLTMSQK